MGNWLASQFFRFDSLWKSNKYIGYPAQGNNRNKNPSFLVRVAAEIVAIQRMEKDRPMNSDDDTDFSSDDDCPRMTAAEEAQMFERERQIAFSGRFTVGDLESISSLREDILSRCEEGPSTSVANLCANRELGCARGRVVNNRKETTLVNSFVPNRRKYVEKVNSKTFCCQYAKNGKILVVASQDERIRFYQKNSRKSKYSSQYMQYNQLKVDVCSWSILDIDVAENGENVCYSTWKNAIFLAKLNDPDEANKSRVTWHHIEMGETEHNVAVFCIRFSRDSDQIVCGTSEYSIHVFDVEKRVRIRTIGNAHEDDVNTVCFADESSNLIYSGGDDGLVKVWDRRAWCDGDLDPVGVFAGHRDGITYVDSRGDDRYLLSNCKDQTIKLWDLRKFSSKQGVDGTRECIRNQNWDYRWQPAPPGLCQPVEGDTSVMTLRGHNVLHTLVRAKFSPERTGKRYIYTGCARGEVVVYDMLTGVVSNRLKGNLAVVRDIDWHPEENEIASCSWDGTTSVWSWDERAQHVTGPYDHAKFGDEDSCDEWYKPLPPRVPRRQKKLPCRRKYPKSEYEDFDDFEI